MLYDPDEVSCDPDDFRQFKLFKKKQQKELLELAFERKRNCQKLDLMKLRIKEFELNERMWKSFENNRRGDFLRGEVFWKWMRSGVSGIAYSKKL